MNNKCCHLQDVLEQAIISEQSGRPLEDLPGMSLQQFPYPCSIDDRYVIITKKCQKIRQINYSLQVYIGHFKNLSPIHDIILDLFICNDYQIHCLRKRKETQGNNASYGARKWSSLGFMVY